MSSFNFNTTAPTSLSTGNSIQTEEERLLEGELQEWASHASGDEQRARAVRKILQCYRNHNDFLDLSGLELTNFPINAINRLRELENLDLSENPWGGDNDLQSLNLPNLTMLRINRCNVSAPQIPQLPNLERVLLMSCPLLTSIDGIAGGPNLIDLNLNNCHNLTSIRGIDQRMQNLRNLNLGGCNRVLENGVPQEILRLQLSSLNLQSCGVTDLLLSTIIRGGLSRRQSPIHLNLSENPLTQIPDEAFTHLPPHSTIEVHGCPISNPDVLIGRIRSLQGQELPRRSADIRIERGQITHFQQRGPSIRPIGGRVTILPYEYVALGRENLNLSSQRNDPALLLEKLNSIAGGSKTRSLMQHLSSTLQNDENMREYLYPWLNRLLHEAAVFRPTLPEYQSTHSNASQEERNRTAQQKFFAQQIIHAFILALGNPPLLSQYAQYMQNGLASCGDGMELSGIQIGIAATTAILDPENIQQVYKVALQTLFPFEVLWKEAQQITDRLNQQLSSDQLDPLEVYLGLIVLVSQDPRVENFMKIPGSNEMLFSSLSHVTPHDIDLMVAAILSPDKQAAYLAAFTPWQQALQKYYPERYATAMNFTEESYSSPNLTHPLFNLTKEVMEELQHPYSNNHTRTINNSQAIGSTNNNDGDEKQSSPPPPPPPEGSENVGNFTYRIEEGRILRIRDLGANNGNNPPPQ